MACWDLYPLSTDPGDAPGTRIVRGQKYTPVAGKECVMRDPDGVEWEGVKPEAEKHHADPTKTKLSEFPQFPITYRQVDPFGRMQTHKLRKTEGDSSGNFMHFVLYTLIADRWIKLADSLVANSENPLNARAWINRLRKEFTSNQAGAKGVNCTLICGPEMLRMYRIANAAEYMAGYWARQSLVPPEIPPMEVVRQTAQRLEEKAEEKIKEALSDSTPYLIALGGAIAFGAGLYIARR